MKTGSATAGEATSAGAGRGSLVRGACHPDGGLRGGCFRRDCVQRQAAASACAMERSYIKRPENLPAPGAVLGRRSRAVPLAIAVVLVSVLWLTIGLPVLGQLTDASGGTHADRRLAFSATAQGRRGPARSETSTSIRPSIIAGADGSFWRRVR